VVTIVEVEDEAGEVATILTVVLVVAEGVDSDLTNHEVCL
jgi:hypothetical protein